jgi:RNA polymerase sigma-70 factor (ECF subfamily)
MKDARGAGDVASLQPLLFSIAYRMLGSVADAEDLVQEAFLRYERARADGVGIDSPKAYLTTVATRLAIDGLRSARVRRETYPGSWLPEPLLTDRDELHPDVMVDRADTLSMAFLVLLERLNPVERAVFLLHDVFGYEFTDIADIVGKSEANCRQIAVRARRYIEDGKPRFESSREKRDVLAEGFFAAVTEGDVDRLVEMLAADVVVYGDGGGKTLQWTAPIAGVERVARLLANVGNQVRAVDGRFELREVNGQPGALVLAPRWEAHQRLCFGHRREQYPNCPVRHQSRQARAPRISRGRARVAPRTAAPWGDTVSRQQSTRSDQAEGV